MYLLNHTIFDLDAAENYGKRIEGEQNENSNRVKRKGAADNKNAFMHIYLFSRFLWAGHDN